MRYLFLSLSLILGIALSTPGCSSSAPAKRRSASTPADAIELPPPAGPVVVFPVQPGAGEQSVIGVAKDEELSFLVALNTSGVYSIAQDRTVCKPGDPSTCKELDVCAHEVETRVCEFAELEGDPVECHDMTLRDGYAVEIATSAPYVGVEMRSGVCVDAERFSTPIKSGALFWCFPDASHERAHGDGKRCVDMAAGGGSPAPNGGTWYTVPVVPPKGVSAVSWPAAIFAPQATPIHVKEAACGASWRRAETPIQGALVCTAANSCLECQARAIKAQGAFWRACLPVTDGKHKFYMCSHE